MLLNLDLPLKQLVYTSFSDVGFKLLTSEQVPLKIQQTFLKQVVDRYWNTYEPKSLSYRAVYLLQVTLKQWLFGWLYHDKLNEVDHSHIPYFICYYIAEPLYTLRLEKICICLQKGPVELIDYYSTSVSLKPLILKDMHLYQEARPGVVIPWKIREQIYTAFKQEKLIDIFIPFNERKGVIELGTQVQPQELNTKSKSTNDNSSLPLIPVNEQKEQKGVIELGTQVQPQKLNTNSKNTNDNSLLPLIPVNEQKGVIELGTQVQPQKLNTNSKNTNENFWLLSKNSILLIGMGFGATTIIGVVLLIYILFQTKVLLWHQSTQPPNVSRGVEKLE